MKKINLTNFEELLDEEYGKPGTPERDTFEQKVINDIIADEFKKRRETLGLSHKDLSEITGLSKYIIEKIEKNADKVSLHNLFKVAKALGFQLQISLK